MRKNWYKQRLNIMAQRSKRSRLQPVQIISAKIRFLEGHKKRPSYRPETASAVLMKYLVQSDKKRQAEPPVDLVDAFFKGIAATVKSFLRIIK